MTRIETFVKLNLEYMKVHNDDDAGFILLNRGLDFAIKILKKSNGRLIQIKYTPKIYDYFEFKYEDEKNFHL